jgi:hypothetical protein
LLDEHWDAIRARRASSRCGAFDKPMKDWQTRRTSRDARIAAGARLAKGKIVSAPDTTKLLEALRPMKATNESR